jgi:hypothetical protein
MGGGTPDGGFSCGENVAAAINGIGCYGCLCTSQLSGCSRPAGWGGHYGHGQCRWGASTIIIVVVGSLPERSTMQGAVEGDGEAAIGRLPALQFAEVVAEGTGERIHLRSRR